MTIKRNNKQEEDQMYLLEQIIGKKVTAIKGFRTDKRIKKCIDPVYILFNDQKTFVTLEEQDYYTYHDCASTARHIQISVDEKRWVKIMSDNNYYPHANIDI